MLPGCATLTSTPASASALGFASVDKSLLDNVMLPPGYQYSVLHATGDALDSALAAYSNKGLESDDWSRRVGDHHDGMDIYYIDANGRYSEKETARAVPCRAALRCSALRCAALRCAVLC